MRVCHSITRACKPQYLAVRRSQWHDIPESFTILILKNPSPRESQIRRQPPTSVLIVEPQAYQVSLATLVVFERLAPMHDPHVVNEPHVALIHGRLDLMLFRYKMKCVQGFRLRLGQAWNSLRSGCQRSVPNQ